jgi:excisionase family DNA binding protein
MDKFFTTEEAAAELGVTTARTRQLIRAGILKAQQYGRAYLVTPAAIAEARKRHSKPGPVPKSSPGLAPKAKSAPASGQDGRVIVTKKRSKK